MSSKNSACHPPLLLHHFLPLSNPNEALTVGKKLCQIHHHYAEFSITAMTSLYVSFLRDFLIHLFQDFHCLGVATAHRA